MFAKFGEFYSFFYSTGVWFNCSVYCEMASLLSAVTTVDHVNMITIFSIDVTANNYMKR